MQRDQWGWQNWRNDRNWGWEEDQSRRPQRVDPDYFFGRREYR
jgi:hypothetical protein